MIDETLHFDTLHPVELSPEAVALQLAVKHSNMQGRFFNEFFKALWDACGGQHRTEMQLLYLADELTDDTAQWMLGLAEDALKAQKEAGNITASSTTKSVERTAKTCST